MHSVLLGSADILQIERISVPRVFDLMRLDAIWNNCNYPASCASIYRRDEVASSNGLGDPTPTD